ncbi:MAG: acyltransferase [Clostridiales bacterium]|nr:acyltransferase [Clostridiales bacterium]
MCNNLVKYLTQIDNNIKIEENVCLILQLVVDRLCDDEDIINNVDKHCVRKLQLLNFIAVSAINSKVYDIVIPLLKRAYDIDNKNTETNYNMAYVLHMFGEDKLALDYLFNIDSDEERVTKLKLEILNNASSQENNNLICNNEEDSDYYIHPSCDVRDIDRMKISSKAIVQANCWLDIAYDNPNHKYLIEIGEGSNIGRRSEISAANKIVIGKNVLIAPNVFIADCSHEYRDINTPVMFQGLSGIDNEVHIGDGSWIGTNSVICGNITIGKNCVVGSNTIVKGNIPDYSIAVGNPSKIIKMFDTKVNKWININNKSEIDEILKNRTLI